MRNCFHIKAMGCRNSPLTIKPYPMKIRGEYIALFRAFTLITNEIFFGRINSTKDIRKVGETPYWCHLLFESSMRLLGGSLLLLSLFLPQVPDCRIQVTWFFLRWCGISETLFIIRAFGLASPYRLVNVHLALILKTRLVPLATVPLA